MVHPMPPYPSASPLAAPAPPVALGRPVPGRALLGAALGYLLAFVATAVAFVWTPAGQRLDGGLLPRAERGGGYEQPTDLVGPAKGVLAWFGDPLLLGLLLVTVLLLAVLRGRAWAGLAGVGLVGAAALGAVVAKQLIVRPDLAVAGSTTHNSFPSGHVAVAMALLLAVLLVLPPAARWWFALPGAVGVATVAAATMIAGWHRFSDVVGAVLLAAALFCLAAAGLARRATRAGTGAAGAVAAGLGLLGLLAGVPQVAPHVPGGLFVAVTAAAGLVVLVVTAILVMVAPLDFAASPQSWWNRTGGPGTDDRA